MKNKLQPNWRWLDKGDDKRIVTADTYRGMSLVEEFKTFPVFHPEFRQRSMRTFISMRMKYE